MRVSRLPWALLPALILTAPSRPAACKDEPPRFALGAALSAYEPTEERDLREVELLYASLSASFREKGFGARVEIRGREGKLREYYPSSLWLEEGYAFVETPLGEVRAGKVASVVGPSDDPSFGGDLLSLNGVNRNPDWGVLVAGSRSFGWNSLEWAARWAGRNDRVAWEEEGKGVESDLAAWLEDGLSARVSFLLNRGLWTLRPALSGGTARIVPDDGRPEYRRSDGMAGVTATLGPVSLELSGLARSAPDPLPGEVRPLAERDGSALFAGLRAEFPTVVYRYTYSEWRYEGASSNERIHQPAVSWVGRKGIEAIVEYEARRIRTGGSARNVNAFRLGIVLRFPFGAAPGAGRGGKG